MKLKLKTTVGRNSEKQKQSPGSQFDMDIRIASRERKSNVTNVTGG